MHRVRRTRQLKQYSKVAEATSAAKTAESKAEEAKNAANGVVAIRRKYYKSLAEEAKGAAEKIDLEPLNKWHLCWMRSEITTGSIDTENGLMSGAPSLAETVEGVDEDILTSQKHWYFRNQKAPL